MATTVRSIFSEREDLVAVSVFDLFKICIGASRSPNVRAQCAPNIFSGAQKERDTTAHTFCTSTLPYPFKNYLELLAITKKHNWSVAEVMRRNERYWRSDEETQTGLLKIWQAMQQCVDQGCRTEGMLPGEFGVRRRAADFFKNLNSQGVVTDDPLSVLDWISLYTLAVSEESAAGRLVVTAPTNNAGGIVAAVLHFYAWFVKGASDKGITDFLLTAAAIGISHKEKHRAFSGNPYRFPGEIGIACSMAAGALCAVMGGSSEQVRHAADIGDAYDFGEICDVTGVNSPMRCYEQNAVASIKAISAARMVLRTPGLELVEEV